MLRLVILLAIWVLSAGAAWADGLGDPTSLSAWAGVLKDGGPWAFLVIAGWVIWGQKNEIKELNKDLITATGKAEKVAGDITNAIESLEAANKSASDRNDERWASVKDMSEGLTKVGSMVGGNGDAIRDLRSSNSEAIRDLKNVVEGMRGDVMQTLLRRQS